MMMLDDWNIDVDALPGYSPLPAGWPEPDTVLFAIPESPFAYVVYTLSEVGMEKWAGRVAVFRDQECPSRVFAPNCWYVAPNPSVIRCNCNADILLVTISNTYDTLEKHALVDLRARRFSPVFIPFVVAGYTFTQLDAHRFAMIPPTGDSPPYHRSYLIEPIRQKWHVYEEKDGVDEVTMPSRYTASGWQLTSSVWQFREMGWQMVWGHAYQIALETETPNDAEVITDRVLEQIDVSAVLGPVQGGYAVTLDEEQLRPRIAEERASLHREQRGQSSQGV